MVCETPLRTTLVMKDTDERKVLDMHFDGGVNRPPYETADGFLQVTRGCSHNRCLFCTYFKDVPFSKSPLDEIEDDIKKIPSYFGAPRRIFLQSADGFAADYDTRHCDLLMLGCTGTGRGLECAQATAALENETKPSKILVNTMSAFVGTRLDEDIRSGAFVPSTEKENLQEERDLLDALDLPECYFWAVHPLDSVKLEGMLGSVKENMIEMLDWSIDHVDEGAIGRVSRVGTL